MGTPASDERTGYTVILFLEEYPEYWPVDGVRVHSLNPSGKQKMLAAIERHYGRIFQHERQILRRQSHPHTNGTE